MTMTTESSEDKARELLALASTDQLGVLPKPRKGEACNGCGMCCTVEPCALAREFLACSEGPCVALEHEAGRTFCGLVRRPVHYLLKQDAPQSVTGPLQAQLAGMLGLGHGCDSDDA
jgi:hypothetical protein